MELADVVAVVDHLARDDQLVLVVDRDLHIVARDALTALDQKPGVGIGQRQLRLAARLQPSRDRPARASAWPSAPQLLRRDRRRLLRRHHPTVGVLGCSASAASLSSSDLP